MVTNAADFSTDFQVSLRGDSNPQPAAYKAAALPLSYPGVWAASGRPLSAFSFLVRISAEPTQPPTEDLF